MNEKNSNENIDLSDNCTLSEASLTNDDKSYQINKYYCKNSDESLNPSLLCSNLIQAANQRIQELEVSKIIMKFFNLCDIRIYNSL